MAKKLWIVMFLVMLVFGVPLSAFSQTLHGWWLYETRWSGDNPLLIVFQPDGSFLKTELDPRTNAMRNIFRGTFSSVNNSIVTQITATGRINFGLTEGSDWLDRNMSERAEINEFVAVNGRQPSARESAQIRANLDHLFSTTTMGYSMGVAGNTGRAAILPWDGWGWSGSRIFVRVDN